MEPGGSAAVLGATQEPRGQRGEEKGAGAAAAERRRGGMKFHVSARAPHGVGALLLVGGAAVVGAAVLAWRASRRGKKGGAAGAGDQRDRQSAKDEVLDGGVVEDGKVQGGALVQKLDQPNENLSAGDTETGSGGLDGKAAEKSHQVHKDGEITGDQLDSKPEEKIDQNSDRNPAVKDNEQSERNDQNSSTNHVEITTHDDMCQDNGHVEEINHVERTDQNSRRSPAETVMQEMVTVCLIRGNMEKVDEDSSKNDVEKEIVQKDNKDAETSDQSRLSIKNPGIILNKQNDQNDGIQEAESMENTPTAQLMMHQEQLLDDMVTDTVTETEEEKEGEGTIIDETELKQDEKKALAGLVELVSSPALSSLIKPTDKKEPEFLRRNETGMKIEQDHTNGELRQHDLISKGEAMQGGAMATMDRRSHVLAILALIFAMTIGITIIVRVYTPARATKFQMGLQ
ncbi:hypothetical protein U9M48_036957 [Paspalum notatum var. saurae]|uniref:Uncharacterized protein n=1 Tax=Paspalum notatum var. saurae TaxID=547442 RepID=A0AAQ3UEP1_PASNO